MFSFTLVAAALVAYAHANPIEASASDASASDLAAAASFPKLDFTSSLAPLPTSAENGTLPSDSFQGPSTDLGEAIFPATLLICPSLNCANCLSYDLLTTPMNTCFRTTPFVSMAIVQPSNEGLPFGVFVGPPGCHDFLKIPAVNICVNVISGGPFNDFALVS
ncbi:uncharacterized protein BXZ73DRAFT_96162 [Epithele typhae]|uniref:uncharacterized protein n=1 Tax=Epithele typhae TaxID=378194 RepID=UPI00200846C4|nr:uncharacterized protein BXZ73DRAFT_96162 [Epithele typhae]KAH9945174.1 hypothetical protein BXZ73DRAFT_96162 [Epithele typhae]